MRICDRLRPSEVSAGRVTACLGIVSDTHLPDRCLALPAALAEVFEGVDLVLHAGDVGALTVIDELSRIAPVVAVHGNDEPRPGTQEHLPPSQVLAVAGTRILLVHGHHRDKETEMASRRQDRWEPKIRQWAGRAAACGARVIVHGHTHIACAVEVDDSLVFNPGAIAPGAYHTRMIRQSVGLLYVRDDGDCFPVHVDLARPEEAFAPVIDWEAGFAAALATVQEPIFTGAALEAFRRSAALIKPDNPWMARLRDFYRPICAPFWASESGLIDLPLLLAAAREHPIPEERETLLAVLTG
jgi:putative phosphoesterase